MKHLSIDIETGGLDPLQCDVIEFAAVVDDFNVQAPLDTLPVYHCYFTRERYSGEAYALSMHGEIFRRIAKKEPPYKYLDLYKEFVPDFAIFLKEHFGKEKICVSGKNFASFDLNFLMYLPGWDDLNIHHRYIDPAMLYFDPFSDKAPPSTEQCLIRAGLPSAVSHTAEADAKAVIQLLRHKYQLSGNQCRCGQKATIHINEIRYDVKTEKHQCDRCAAQEYQEQQNWNNFKPGDMK